ncbi:hypothetical protein [Dietzia aurantiaca]|uniref:LGFP repeat-containing protein n=1 Tax=Dietzia aurantiaca TaxID=983873 RepID=A0ABV9PY73_9ACTN
MDRIMRVVAVLSLTAVAGAGLSACAGGDEGSGGTAAPETAVMSTTTTTPPGSSATVPGPAGDEVRVPGAVAERWAELGGVEGELGAATGPAEDVDGGSISGFDRGALVLTPSGRAFLVQGEILTAYLEAGGPGGELGFPTADEATTDGGWISTFDGGVITYLDGVAEVELN